MGALWLPLTLEEFPMSTTTPPGWYPDPSGRHGTRWWDGAGWTEHVGPPTSQMPRPRIPDGTSTATVSVWLLALLPLLSLPVAFLYQPHLQYEVVGPGGYRTVDPRSVYTAGYFLQLGFSVVVYAAGVVLAFLDHRALERRGVVRPFPWPWSFLSPVVYLIGRYVVVRKVAPGRSMWPLWVGIALVAVGIVVGIGRAVVLVQQTLP